MGVQIDKACDAIFPSAATSTRGTATFQVCRYTFVSFSPAVRSATMPGKVFVTGPIRIELRDGTISRLAPNKSQFIYS